MEVLIVIPTIDSKDELPRLLDSIIKFDIDNKAEVIIVDSASKDNTVEIAKEYGFPKIIQLDRASKGKARNEGIKLATGNIIVNLDSDTELLEGWYEELVKSMQYADIVTGYAPDPKIKQMARVPIFVDGQDITYPFCNIAHKKEVFDKVGYIREEQGLAEDCEFNYRCVKAGYVINYNPKMKLLHHQRTSKIGFCKQAFWNGESRYELNAIHPELKHAHQHGVTLKNFVRLGFGFLGLKLGRFYRTPGEKVWHG